MITENLSTLKIHKLTQAQYDRALEAGNIDESALYLTPEEEIDLSPYATIEQVNAKSDADHNHDDVYYTEVEVDTLLLNKSDTSHNHDDVYDAKGSASTAVDTHNSSTSAHSDIRESISSLQTNVQTQLDNNVESIIAVQNSVDSIMGNEGASCYWRKYNSTSSSLYELEYDDFGFGIDEYINYPKRTVYKTITFNETTGEITLSNPLDSNGTDLETIYENYQEYPYMYYDEGDILEVGAYYKILEMDKYMIDGYDYYTYSYRPAKLVPTLVTKYAKGSYIEDITSDNADAYPVDGHSNGYWYVKKITIDDLEVSATKINYLEGITSNVQVQLDEKVDSSHTHDDYLTVSNPTGKGSFSMNRASNSEVGEYSSVLGEGCVASGRYSHAQGYVSNATNDYTHAQGYNTTASGMYAHSQGCNTEASGIASSACGWYTVASGTYSHAGGNNTTALSYQHAQGHYNNTTNAKAGVSSGTGTGTAFVVGNGTADAGSNAFRVNCDGKPYCKSSMTTTGCDYAEYFEWEDLNTNNEDRRGYFVTLDEDKIKIAEPNDYILGIISGQPSVIGNGDEDWMGRYVFDEFGAFVYEEFEYEAVEFDKETGETKTVTKTGTKYKENPNYDPSIAYIQREDRPEWDAVGMLGVLSVRDDGTCKVNGYCTVAEGGIATSSETGYRVIKRVTDNIVKVIFR